MKAQTVNHKSESYMYLWAHYFFSWRISFKGIDFSSVTLIYILHVFVFKASKF